MVPEPAIPESRAHPQVLGKGLANKKVGCNPRFSESADRDAEEYDNPVLDPVKLGKGMGRKCR